jgi:uncharacterized protein YodC (DUF2158 family)
MFELGTVVKLKGFETKMTVDRISEAGLVECVWFDVDQVRRATYDADRLIACGKQVMVCKLQLHALNVGGNGYDKENKPLPAAQIRMGGVWEGSSEKQAMSENAVFGHWTPCAEFSATIMNQHVIERLKQGKKYYVTFTEAPD